MSSPFSSNTGRVILAWEKQAIPARKFVPYNPFGTFVIDQGYGSGGYGDLPYGEGIVGSVTFSTTWTAVTDK